MFSKKERATFCAFWQSFCREPLYNSGFSDAVVNCGAHREDTWQDDSDAIASLAYLNGFAQAGRLANVYMSPGWHICNLLSIAAGMQLAMLREGRDPTGRARHAQSMCDTWTRELVAELARKAA